MSVMRILSFLLLTVAAQAQTTFSGNVTASGNVTVGAPAGGPVFFGQLITLSGDPNVNYPSDYETVTQPPVGNGTAVSNNRPSNAATDTSWGTPVWRLASSKNVCNTSWAWSVFTDDLHRYAFCTTTNADTTGYASKWVYGLFDGRQVCNVGYMQQGGPGHRNVVREPFTGTGYVTAGVLTVVTGSIPTDKSLTNTDITFAGTTTKTISTDNGSVVLTDSSYSVGSAGSPVTFSAGWNDQDVVYGLYPPSQIARVNLRVCEAIAPSKVTSPTDPSWETWDTINGGTGYTGTNLFYNGYLCGGSSDMSDDGNSFCVSDNTNSTGNTYDPRLYTLGGKNAGTWSAAIPRYAWNTISSLATTLPVTYSGTGYVVSGTLNVVTGSVPLDGTIQYEKITVNGTTYTVLTDSSPNITISSGSTAIGSAGSPVAFSGGGIVTHGALTTTGSPNYALGTTLQIENANIVGAGPGARGLKYMTCYVYSVTDANNYGINFCSQNQTVSLAETSGYVNEELRSAMTMEQADNYPTLGAGVGKSYLQGTENNTKNGGGNSLYVWDVSTATPTMAGLLTNDAGHITRFVYNGDIYMTQYAGKTVHTASGDQTMAGCSGSMFIWNSRTDAMTCPFPNGMDLSQEYYSNATPSRRGLPHPYIIISQFDDYGYTAFASLTNYTYATRPSFSGSGTGFFRLTDSAVAGSCNSGGGGTHIVVCNAPASATDYIPYNTTAIEPTSGTSSPFGTSVTYTPADRWGHYLSGSDPNGGTRYITNEVFIYDLANNVGYHIMHPYSREISPFYNNSNDFNVLTHVTCSRDGIVCSVDSSYGTAQDVGGYAFQVLRDASASTPSSTHTGLFNFSGNAHAQ